MSLKKFINNLIKENKIELTYFDFKEEAEEKGLYVDMSDYRKYQEKLTEGEVED